MLASEYDSCKLCASTFQNHDMTKIEPSKAAVFIIILAAIAIFINNTQHRNWRLHGGQSAMATTQLSYSVFTNTVYINQRRWTRIDLKNAHHVEWSVIHGDFALDAMINGTIYQQPPRDDPSWRPIIIPTKTLLFSVTPGTPVETGVVSVVITYTNVYAFQPQVITPSAS